MRNVVTVYNPVLGKYAPKISFVYLDQFCLQSKLSTSEIIKAEYDKGPSINYVVSKSAIFDPLPPLSRLFTK